ncbi:MAG: heparan-alpha-glucosaminide N-acetyltransferase domain-containing protein, partial [Gemmiger sp.]
MPQWATSRARLWQADALRGLALLNMLAYHAMYDWVYLFGHASGWYDIWSPGCHVWQQYICWSFLLLSGFSFSLSRRPLKNGMVVTGCALVLTLVTVVAM